MSDWQEEKARREAYPETDLLVSTSPDNGCAAVACPYCDETVPLHSVHECVNCGATFDVSVRWSR
jgi:hypothetical protein